MLLHGATIPRSLASSFSETAICKSRGAGKVAVWRSLSTSNTLRRGVVGVRAAQTNEVDSRALTGVIFEPFREVQSQLVQVPTAYSESLARQRYDSSCEAAINEQIKYAFSSPPPPPSFVRAVRNISTSSSTQKGWNQGKETKLSHTCWQPWRHYLLLRVCRRSCSVEYSVSYVPCSVHSLLLTLHVCRCSCSVEYNVSYVYHALFAYFDRDNVGLPGFAK
jgi:hypothetical protein